MALSIEKKKELKSESKSLKPFMSVGKQGITNTTITQIKIYLKANRLGKIKILKTLLDEQGLDKKELAKQLAQDTQSELIDAVGFVVVLYK
jgi:putative YhbY family RNA-binding protein